jgi:hypothetical protein
MPLGLFNVASTFMVIGAVPPILLQSGIDPTSEGLRLEWDVSKSRMSTPDEAVISIYNLASPVRQGLSISSSLPIALIAQLLVGWEGIPELLFTGEIWKVEPAKKTGTDVITTLHAAAGGRALRDTPPAGGAIVGATVQMVIGQLLGQLGFRPSVATLGQIAAAAGQVSLGAFQAGFHGEPREVLDGLMATIGLSWGFDSTTGEFVVYRGGLRNDLLPSILAPQSGLLSWSELDDGGYEFEALAQPRCVPGLQITLLDEFGKPQGGPLRIETITFRGSSEGPSLMTGVARKVKVLG